jgi:hypothetical protein
MFNVHFYLINYVKYSWFSITTTIIYFCTCNYLILFIHYIISILLFKKVQKPTILKYVTFKIENLSHKDILFETEKTKHQTKTYSIYGLNERQFLLYFIRHMVL